MSSLAAFRIASRIGLNTVARQSIRVAPRAIAMARPAVAVRAFTVSSRLQNSLASVLSTEIKSEIATSEPASEVIGSFLKSSGFSVVETEGKDEVELVKKNGAETVHVFFSVSDITNADPETFYEEEAAEFEQENQEEFEDPTPIRANVVIEKASSALGVEAIVQNNLILIESVTPYPSAEAALSNTAEADYKRHEIYQGPPFSNLDENVQSSFESYLEARGINNELADFITEYSVHRENKEYLNWLKNFKTFVEAA